MRKKGKTKADREHEREEAASRTWERFRPKLAALQSKEDAGKLVADPPPPDSPARGYYSNLAFFLNNRMVPLGSSDGERVLYLQFIERLVAAGELEVNAAEKLQQELRCALDRGNPLNGIR